MRTFSNQNYIYIGRRAGREIHEDIKKATKSVKVVSPYLSPNYIKDLIDLHKKGVKITLITCDNIETSSFSDFQVSDLIKKEKIYNTRAGEYKRLLFKLSIGMFIVSVLFALLSFILPMLFTFAGILLFLSIVSIISSQVISDYLFKQDPIFRIKVFDSASGKNKKSTELIHSKIFIIDEKIAFLGSVNFTYSGFNTHYETIIKVEDTQAVKSLSQEVERLYSSTDLRTKNINDW